ncbi:MAG: phage terminase large subunit [Bacilli bacterium]|nr:phage terminase large subunit [Bacilli bacterium]
MNIEFTLLQHQKKLYNSPKDTAILMGGRGCGKSVIISMMIFMHILQGKRCMIFAQNFHALKFNLFAEIEKRFTENNIPVNVNYGDMIITSPINKNGICFGFSYSAVDSCRGTTEISLVCYDELCMAPQDLFAVVNPCLRLPNGQRPKIIGATSPVAGSYWNRWCVEEAKAGRIDLIRAKMRDNKFLSNESIQVIENTFTDSKLRAQELDGEIITDLDDTSIITAAEIVMAKEMMLAPENDRRVYIGIDAAGTGQDKTTIAFRKGHKLLELLEFDRITGAGVLSEIHKFMTKHNVSKQDIGAINLDMAYSEAIYEALISEFEQTKSVSFASKSPDAKYVNMRAYGYFQLAKCIREGLSIDNYEVIEELTNTHWKLDNFDRILLQPKEEIKFVIRRSPDKTDAIMLTCIDTEEELETLQFSVSTERCHELTNILFR